MSTKPLVLDVVENSWQGHSAQCMLDRISSCNLLTSHRLEETETLLAAQRDVNRGLDNDVHTLMAQLEDLNWRYAALGRRTAGLQV